MAPILAELLAVSSAGHVVVSRSLCLVRSRWLVRRCWLPDGRQEPVLPKWRSEALDSGWQHWSVALLGRQGGEGGGSAPGGSPRRACRRERLLAWRVSVIYSIAEWIFCIGVCLLLILFCVQKPFFCLRGRNVR